MNRTEELNRLMNESPFLTDGGLETVLVFQQGIDLPHFASFDLLSQAWGKDLLITYYQDYLDLAARHGAGFILESPTWRANRDWGEKLNYSPQALQSINRQAIALMALIRSQQNRAQQQQVRPILISGNVGPRGDGYRATAKMTILQAQAYHRQQIEVFADSHADLVTAMTLNYLEEAEGIVRAARQADIPVVISFTVETDGRLPSGQPLGDAIKQLDSNTGGYVCYYMINCAHPTHFEHQLCGEDWVGRIRGIRGNASTCSHEELDESESLDDGNPVEFASDYVRLKCLLPKLTVYGGCCGTDHRHVAEVAQACL